MTGALTWGAVAAVYIGFGVVALPRFRAEYGDASAPVLVILFLLGPFAFVLADVIVNVARRMRRQPR
jgi:hypothetical protein